jgi:type IV secretory pathway TrbF-like protein
VIPYIVEVDTLGYAITIPTALTASTTPATVESQRGGSLGYLARAGSM